MKTKYISKKDQNRLEEFFSARSAKIESEPEHWITNSNEGASYCYDCCKKKIAQLKKENPHGDYEIDGGWVSEVEATPFCETCGILLDSSLTDYGARVELKNFIECGFDPVSDYDCRALLDIINACGWEPWEEKIYRNEHEKERDLKYFDDLHNLCRSILERIDDKT